MVSSEVALKDSLKGISAGVSFRTPSDKPRVEFGVRPKGFP